MSIFISKKSITDENRKFKRSKQIMKKTKLPEDEKTHYAKCPFCGNRGWIKEKRQCKICKRTFDPNNKDLPEFVRASRLARAS